MKPFLCVLMLATGIKGTVYAQTSQTPDHSRKTFELPDNYINRRFYLELRQGNEIQLGLKSIKDLDYIGDLDSLIRVCLRDLAPFTDSLSDELKSKKIDYTIDASGRKEVRIRQYAPKGNSFLLQPDGISALKMDQDTIHILAPVNRPLSGLKLREQQHRFEVNIIVNGIPELPSLMSAGIKRKMDTLKRSIDEYFTKADWKWEPGKNRRLHLKQDPDISEEHAAGEVSLNGDRLETFICTSLQNYKNYFVPSINLGLHVLFNSSTDLFHQPSRFKYDLSVSWEPQFFFQSTNGKLQTYRNDFLALNFGLLFKVKSEPSLKNSITFSLPLRLSLAYLINRNGPFYEKNTFRLGTGGVALLKDKYKLEPVIYFSNFFKGVTPGVRLQVTF